MEFRFKNHQENTVDQDHERLGSSGGASSSYDNREEENLVMPLLFGGARLEEIYESAISKQPGMLEWRIQEPLQGELDLTFLGENCPIQVLEFAPGEGDRVITELRGLPKHLKKLTCTHQKLRELRNLPNTLLELNVSYNKLSTLDFSDVPRLKIFRGSHNTLYRLDNLPATLEEMYVDHNRLSTLDLLGLSFLRVLHARYNSHPLILKNVPPMNQMKPIDMKLDDDPFRSIANGGASTSDSESENESETESSEKSTKKKLPKSPKVPYVEALNKYFTLKTKYETSIKTMATKAKKTEKSGKISKKSTKQPKLPECIQCRANVGMTFLKKGQTYSAHCGIGNNHNCSFKIELYSGQHQKLDTAIAEHSKEFEDDKQELLKQKMETLFGWIDETTSSLKFKERLEKYMGDNIYLDSLVNRYQEIHYSKNRQDMEDRQLQEIAEIKAQIHATLNEYRSDPLNKELLRDAMEIHVKELIPKVDQLRKMKYPIMEMDPVIELVEGFMGKEILAVTGYKLYQRTDHLNMIETETFPSKVVIYNL